MARLQDSDSKIRDLTDQFVAELGIVIREAALAAVQDAIDGVSSGGTKRRKKKATRRKKAGRKKATRRKAGRKKRIRRSSADVGAMESSIHAFVRSNPGAGAGQIADGLGVATKDLRLPILNLTGSKRLRTEGQRRGTKYFAGAKRGPKRKRAKKSS